MTVGERIKARRKELGISADSLALCIGVSRSTMFRYEKGDIEKVPGDTLEPIARALHTTPAYLMGWEDSPTPKNIIPMPRMKSVPLIGEIACGVPVLAEENIEEYVDLPEHIKADFALRGRQYDRRQDQRRRHRLYPPAAHRGQRRDRGRPH